MIGLVGGIGSGKSTLARRLDAVRKIAVIEGDEIGHQVLENPAVKKQIRRRFGNSVFNDAGNVDRTALGRAVFGASTEQQLARNDLQAIVHPHIREEMHRQIAEARSSGTVEAVVLDAAVLLEAGWDEMCDAVVFVEASESQRIERVSQTRGWTAEQLNARNESQFPLEQKRSRADYIVDNTGSPSQAEGQWERIVERIIRTGG